MNISPSVRHGSALAGIAGVLLLAGCAGSPTANEAEGTAGAGGTGSTPSSPAPSAASGSSGAYKDGTYTADGSYRTPETVEKITVTVTLSGGVVDKVEVTGDPQARETEQYQGQFIGGISEQVVGKPLGEISVTKVAGSSLTGQGFTQAIEKIRAEAAS
ncbi:MULTISPECIES: FMN-binding protein [Bacteria]|uniref:FMN-binding protein n=1 Tax=Bacteria TaxID=2 RepID=UPI003C7BDD57